MLESVLDFRKYPLRYLGMKAYVWNLLSNGSEKNFTKQKNLSPTMTA